ncbi:hypothetical protein D3C73_791760 [compost metagenome]
MRQLHRPAFEIGSKVTLAKRKQPDIIKQQIPGGINGLAKLFDLFLRVVFKELFSVDPGLAQIADQMIERSVRLLRVGFVTTVYRRSFI